jgi:hypothetical protein
MAEIRMDLEQLRELLGQIGGGFSGGLRLATPSDPKSDCVSVSKPRSQLERIGRLAAALDGRLRADADRGVALAESICERDRSLAEAIAEEVGGRLPR